MHFCIVLYKIPTVLRSVTRSPRKPGAALHPRWAAGDCSQQVVQARRPTAGVGSGRSLDRSRPSIAGLFEPFNPRYPLSPFGRLTALIFPLGPPPQ